MVMIHFNYFIWFKAIIMYTEVYTIYTFTKFSYTYIVYIQLFHQYPFLSKSYLSRFFLTNTHSAFQFSLHQIKSNANATISQFITNKKKMFEL